MSSIRSAVGKFVREIEHGVAHEDVVIEIEDVEADDEIGPAQPIDQLVHARFVEDFVVAGGGAEDHADRHLHVALAIPAAGVVRGSLGFEVEVNDVAPVASPRPLISIQNRRNRKPSFDRDSTRNCSTTAPSS